MRSKSINISRDQFLQFVRTKKDTVENLSKETQHYLSYFDQYMATGKKGNWNFAALLPLWFFYRCMYQNGFIILCFPRVIDRIETKLGEKIAHEFSYLLQSSIENYLSLLNILISLVFVVLCMRYADYFYLVFASRKISKGTITRGTHSKAFFIFMYIGLLLAALIYLLSLS